MIVCVYLHMCACVCMRLCICISAYVCVNCLYMHVCVKSVYVCICVCMIGMIDCVCFSIYVQVYIRVSVKPHDLYNGMSINKEIVPMLTASPSISPFVCLHFVQNFENHTNTKTQNLASTT